MKCDSCHEPTMSVSILGVMPWAREAGRKPARLCDSCTSTCPCGSKGSWWDGHITCKHGYMYDLDYLWEDGDYRRGERARPIFSFLKRTWWSYFICSDSEHAKSSNNAI